LGFLRELGYEGPKVKTQPSRLAKELLVLGFASRQAGRSVDVSYLAARDGKRSAITVSIGSDSDGHFILEDWLAVHGMTDAVPFVQSGSETADAFIQRFGAAFKKIADLELEAILRGRAWERVPFDWKGYR
jgi:sugar/nucleoside kinase (ribokinase family)